MKDSLVIRVGRQISRRDLLRSVGAVGGAISSSFLSNRSVPGGFSVKKEKLISVKEAADHLIFGASDLERAIGWFETATGVKPVIGGVHPGRGTRNALVSLGGGTYLEILAPDPAQEDVSLKYDLRSLTSPQLVHWVAVAKDVNLVAEKARSAGLNPVGPRDGSRARPDGRMLKWSSLDVVNNERVTLIPFFIKWDPDSPHPSQDSPTGCQLQSIEMECPNPASVISTLETFGIKAEVKRAKEARLRATLKTPDGKVELS